MDVRKTAASALGQLNGMRHNAKRRLTKAVDVRKHVAFGKLLGARGRNRFAPRFARKLIGAVHARVTVPRARDAKRNVRRLAKLKNGVKMNGNARLKGLFCKLVTRRTHAENAVAFCGAFWKVSVRQRATKALVRICIDVALLKLIHHVAFVRVNFKNVACEQLHTA